ncbi:MAG: hypothetical protein IV093_07595 [Rubrivivax sp.]|nr:hypothetical protein [Rubrivivax sp.]
MPPAPRPLCEQTYALRLRGPTPDTNGLAGELEHVLSGSCQRFESGAGLLAALQALQAQRDALTPGRSPAAAG